MVAKPHDPQPETQLEQNDGIPAALAVNFRRPPTLQEQIQMLVRTGLDQAAMANEMETFDDADDFDVGDDYDPRSPHEMEFDPLMEREVPREMHSRNFIPETPLKPEDRIRSRFPSSKTAAKASNLPAEEGEHSGAPHYSEEGSPSPSPAPRRNPAAPAVKKF